VLPVLAATVVLCLAVGLAAVGRSSHERADGRLLDTCAIACGSAQLHAAGDGSLFALWLKAIEEDGRRRIAIVGALRDGEGHWLPAAEVSGSSALVADLEPGRSGEAAVAWAEIGDGTRKATPVMLSFYRDGAWSRPRRVSGAYESVVYPRVFLSGDATYVVWTRIDMGTSTLRYARWDGRRLTRGRLSAAGEQVLPGTVQALARSGGGLLVAWSSRTSDSHPRYRLRTTTISQDGTPAAPTTRIRATAHSGVLPHFLLAADGRRALLVAQSLLGSSGEVIGPLYALSLSPAGAPQALQQIAPQGGVALQLARDGEGRVVVAWSDHETGALYAVRRALDGSWSSIGQLLPPSAKRRAAWIVDGDRSLPLWQEEQQARGVTGSLAAVSADEGSLRTSDELLAYLPSPLAVVPDNREGLPPAPLAASGIVATIVYTPMRESGVGGTVRVLNRTLP
jgi:hypothetical protein